MSLLSCCLAAGVEAATDWAVKVISIETNGRAADTVNQVEVLLPGKDKTEKLTLRRGMVLRQGTEITAPRRTGLVLESAHGNPIRLQPGSRFKVNVVSSEGESYTVLLGQAFFNVIRKLNFFNVGYQSFYAIVRGTEFNVAVEPQKEIRFRLLKGKLVVQREVKVKIIEGNKVAQLAISEILTEGRKTEVSYRLGVEEYLREFKTYKDAEDYYRRQLESDEKSGEYERIQTDLNDLGRILWTLGKPREAIGYYERALKTVQERHDRQWEAALLNNIGTAWDDLGEHKKAIDYYSKALMIDLKVYGCQHQNVAIDYNNIGESWRKLGDPKKAIDYYTKALMIDLEVFGCQHQNVATIYNNIGSAWHNLGEYKKAIDYYSKALMIDLEVYNCQQHQNVAALYNNIGESWRKLGDPQKAIDYGMKALMIDVKVFGDLHPNVARDYNNIGLAWHNLGEYKKAIDYYMKALMIDLENYASQYPKVVILYNNIGAAWYNLGEYDKAIKHFENALAISQDAYPDGLHPALVTSYQWLSLTWQKLGNQERSEEYAKKASELEARIKH